jgi:hypothetical protein
MSDGDYERGFKMGWTARSEVDFAKSQGDERETYIIGREKFALHKQKRKQSPKQKLLAAMTEKKWKVYKKGSGKKTYFEIRAQVSKSQDYKKKAKRL